MGARQLAREGRVYAKWFEIRYCNAEKNMIDFAI